MLAACGQPSTPASSKPAAAPQPTGAEVKPTGVSGDAPVAPTATVPAGIEGGYLYGFNATNQLALTTTPGFPEMMQSIVLENTPVKQAIDEQVKRMNAAIAQAQR